MKLVHFLFLLFAFSACQNSVPSRPIFNKQGESPQSQGKDEVGSEPGENGKDLNLNQEHGSKLRFADSIGLTAIYARVFKKKELGFQHCASKEHNLKDLPLEATDCDNIFSAKERPEMGTFDIYFSEFGRGPNNKTAVTSLKLGYLRTLRSMLIRECSSLLEKELGNLANRNVAENIFVSAEKPSSSAIESYIARILGIEGRKIATGIDYNAYALALQASLKEAAGDSDKVRAAWVNGCVSVSMDPIVFIY